MATSFYVKGWTGNLTRNVIEKFRGELPVAADPTAIADFNGDGHLDILLQYCQSAEQSEELNYSPVKGRLLFLAGDGRGGFKDATGDVLGSVSLGGSMRKIAVGDFNGDGAPDVAAAFNREDGRALEPGTAITPQYVFLSNGKTLDVVSLGVRQYAHALAVGDLNRDGRDDIITGGFDKEESHPTATTAFLQLPDGTMSEPAFLDGRSGLAEVIGDFDGDGDNELADDYADPDDPTIVGLRLTEVNADGSLGSSTITPNPPLRWEDGVSWSGGAATFGVYLDTNGEEFIDQGLNDLKAADFDGDGRDEVLGIRFGFEMYRLGGVLHEKGAEGRNALELYELGDDGLEPMAGFSIKGWTSAPYGILDVKIIDFNGDGHLDLYVPWSYDSPDDRGVGVRLFLNDGAAHFTRVKQALLPETKVQFLVSYEPIDANEDGIMDILVRADGFEKQWNKWDGNSETVYLGTKKFFTGPGYSDPALKGAAGFNEQYYLNTYADALKAVKKGKFDDGLDHYLNVGREKGYLGFAVDTHIFGAGKNDTIKAREGEEWLDGGLGKDKLTGGASGDTFVFSTKLGATNVDKVTDFNSADGDRVALDSDIFRRIGPVLDAGEFYAAKGAVAGQDRNDRIIYDTATGKLRFDIDGNKPGGAAAVHFATFTAMPELDANSFIIV